MMSNKVNNTPSLVDITEQEVNSMANNTPQTNTQDDDYQQKIDDIVGTFIALKFDIDTDEFSDGTLGRWNNMKADLLRLHQEAILYFIKQLVEKHYDEQFGTYDYDGIAEEVLSYVE